MNARPLTDAQISQALRAHLPEQAAAGLRERVIDAAETTAQLRSFPSFLGALSDADPVGRRRNLLIAAALLVALAFASAAAVGALRLLAAGPVPRVGPGAASRPPGLRPLEPRAAAPAAAAHVRPWHQQLGQGPHLRRSVRRGPIRSVCIRRCDGALQLQDLSPNHRISGMANVESEAVWVEQGQGTTSHTSTPDGIGRCEMERDSSEVANGSAAAGWRYVGLEYVAGRPTHHVTCVGDLWIDIETTARSCAPRGRAVDDAGQPIPVESTEVTEMRVRRAAGDAVRTAGGPRPHFGGRVQRIAGRRSRSRCGSRSESICSVAFDIQSPRRLMNSWFRSPLTPPIRK